MTTNARMAFRRLPRTRLSQISPGDYALMVTTRHAYGNPVDDLSRVIGRAQILGDVAVEEDLLIGGRDFYHVCDILIEVVLPRGRGVILRNFVDDLEFVKRPDKWGQYIRNPPILLPERDYEVLNERLDRIVRMDEIANAPDDTS